MTSVASVVELLSKTNPFANGGSTVPEAPPRPAENNIPRTLPSSEQLQHVQQILDGLHYNHLPRTFFCLEKHRSFMSIMGTAKEMLEESLPIRCLEASFLATYLTQPLKDVDRIPVSFKSRVRGELFLHIVLVVRAPLSPGTPSLYGALGLSRKRTLMDKPLKFRSFYALIVDYLVEYCRLGHEMLEVRIGLNMSHDSNCRSRPCWRFVALKMSRFSLDRIDAERLAACREVHHQEVKRSRSNRSRSRGTQNASPLRSSEVCFRRSSPDKLRMMDASSSTQNGCSDSHVNSLVLSDSGEIDGSGGAARRAKLVEGGVASLDTTLDDGEVTPSKENPTCVSSPSAGEVTTRSLSVFLGCYSRLLEQMSEQYLKGIAGADGSVSRIFLCSLDLLESGASKENERRLRLVLRERSPISYEERKAAATAHLREQAARPQSRHGGADLGGTATNLSSTARALGTSHGTASKKAGVVRINGTTSPQAVQSKCGAASPPAASSSVRKGRGKSRSRSRRRGTSRRSKGSKTRSRSGTCDREEPKSPVTAVKKTLAEVLPVPHAPQVSPRMRDPSPPAPIITAAAGCVLEKEIPEAADGVVVTGNEWSSPSASMETSDRSPSVSFIATAAPAAPQNCGPASLCTTSPSPLAVAIL